MLDALRGFSAALLPPDAGGPDPSLVAPLVDRMVTGVPEPSRTVLRLGFRAVDAYARRSEGAALIDLAPEARERVMRRLTRSAQGALALDGLKTLVCMVAGTEGIAADLRDRSNREPVARPDPVLDCTPSSWWPSSTAADVVVIGSGAGGAMAARTLARAGLDTVVLEEGRRFFVDEFRDRHPVQRFGELYRGAGTTLLLGSPPIVMPIGRGVGGTTLVNSGTCFRTPRPVLERWRDAHGLRLADPDAIAAHFADVEDTIGVAPVPADVMGRNGELALAGAKALGWSAGPLMRNAPGCDGCCQCSIGCPRNAKAGVHLNALPQACAAGARIVERATVTRILHDDGRVRGVAALRPDGTSFTIESPRVVVACGATETPLLLRRSGLGRHRMVGRNLAVHPGIGVAGRFAEPVTAWQGVLQSVGIDEYHESDGILVEATSTPPGLGSTMMPGYGRDLVSVLDAADHMATLGAMIADRPRGRVLGRRRAYLTYALAKDDGARLVKAVSIMGRVLFAAGAEEVLTGFPRDPAVRDVDALEAACARVDYRSIHVAAFHPTGTVAAGGDPERHPVDAAGRLRGVDGVWVADASVLPTCPEVNPQVTIMALALGVASGIVEAPAITRGEPR